MRYLILILALTIPGCGSSDKDTSTVDTDIYTEPAPPEDCTPVLMDVRDDRCVAALGYSLYGSCPTTVDGTTCCTAMGMGYIGIGPDCDLWCCY